MSRQSVRILTLAFLISFLPRIVRADSPVSTAQLLQMTQQSLQDYSTNNPEMARSISGFKATVAVPNVKIIIYMVDGTMNMTANYLCVPSGTEFGCHFQN